MTNPSNIVRVRSRAGGHASVYEANMWAQKWPQGLFSGNGVLQNTVPDMNVLVGGTPSNPDVVIGQNPAGYKIVLDIIGQQPVLITAPASNSRITSIVAYTNDLSVASADPATTGSPSSCGLIVVNGTTSASPVAPTDSQIRSAITADGGTGSQAAYGIVASMLVASTTTSLTNTSIGLLRSLITQDVIADNAVIASKLDSNAIGHGYVELKRTTLSVAGDAISLQSIPVYKYLYVEAYLLAIGGTISSATRFNNDSANNYARRLDNNGSQAGVTNVPELNWTNATSTTVKVQMWITNIATRAKLVTVTATEENTAGSATAPGLIIGGGKWHNTSQAITRIDILNLLTGDYAIGSEAVVFGKN